MQKYLHANLTSQQFPIDFRELSNTIVLNDGFEQNRQLVTGFSGQDYEQSFGICQAYFMQNVLPISRGYASVHYDLAITKAENLSTSLDHTFVLQNSLNQICIYSPASALNLIYDPSDGFWKSQVIGSFDAQNVSVAYLKQEHYICIPNVGLYNYNFSTKQLEQLVVVGISFDGVLGVFSAGNQLILWTKSQLYWSSVNDPLDFTPSTATGAGASGILSLKGAIITCKPYGAGYIVYSSANAIHASPTNSLTFPWAFLEIKDSVGISTQFHVTDNATQSNHILWSGSGFMAVQPTGFTAIWPELSDALARGVYVRADTSGNPFVSIAEVVGVKLSTIGSKYICVSIKVEDGNTYNHAYIYNLVLQRWGRLDVPHTGFFEFVDPAFTVLLTYDQFAAQYLRYANIPDELRYADLGIDLSNLAPKAGDNFGVVLPDASIFLAKFASKIFPDAADPVDPRGYALATAAEPQILLGRFKISRRRGVKLQYIKFERAIDCDVRSFGHDTVGARVLANNNLVPHSRIPSQYYGRLVGDSLSISLRGTFVLSDLTVIMSDAGNRNLPANAGYSLVINGTDFVNQDEADVVVPTSYVLEDV